MTRQHDQFIDGQDQSGGYGRETGAEGFNEFTILKTLVINCGKRADIYSV